MRTTRKTFNPLHMMLTTILLVLAIAALAACGDAVSTGASIQPTATLPAEVAPTPTITAMEDMEMAPTTEAAPTSTTQSADPIPAPDQADNTGTATPPPATPGEAGTTTEIQATLREWAIDLSRQEVPAGKIRFTVTNQGRMDHNLTVTSDSGTIDKTSNFRSSDGPQTLEVDLQPGTYTLICDLPGHAQRGQRIELTVK